MSIALSRTVYLLVSWVHEHLQYSVQELREHVAKENPNLACTLSTLVASEDVKEYKCFNDYYKDRYEMHNLRPDQPLIECTSMRRVSILKRARNFLRKGWHLYRTTVEDMEESASEMVHSPVILIRASSFFVLVFIII